MSLPPEDFDSMFLFPNEMLENDDMQDLLRIFSLGGQGQGQGSFNATEDNANQTQEISQIGEQNVVKETGGLDLDKSSNKKQRKLRSPVWNHFEKYKDENGKDVAKCNICKKPFNGSSDAGTTHLWNHFKSCSLNKKNEGGGSASGDKPAENSNQTQEISQIGEQNVVKETVGLDFDKSSNKKQKKLRSDAWKNFEKYKDENGKDWAKCNICEKLFDGSSKMRTTNLKNHFKSCSKNKKNEGGGSGSGDKPAEDSVMDQQLNHLDKSNEGGGSASGDIPAEDSVMDQQLNHLDKSNEGGGSASGDKPAEDSVMDQQLNHLDRVKMLFKQCSWLEPLPTSIETADISNVYNEEKEKLCIYFEKLTCRLSLVTNTNLLSFGRYICFWVHFIDDDWKLKKKMISLKCISGDPIKKILKNVLSEWGIDNNISYMVLDRYSYKNVLSSNERENGFSSQGSLLFNGKLFCIRDFNYILSSYSDCIDGIENVIYYRMKKNFEYISGKIKQVLTGVILTEQDIEDWRVVDLIEKGLGLKEAFFELENVDIEFKSINLTKEEWDAVTTFCNLNVETADKTFGDGYKTLNMFFPWLCSTYWTSVELVKLKPFIDETESLHSIRDRMKCWYDDNLVVAVAAVLDPRFKMDVVKHWYKKIYGDEYETRLEKFKEYLTRVYNEYAKGTNDFQSSALGSKETKAVISYEMLDPSGKPRKFSHDHHQSPNSELHLYLEDFKFPLIRDFNILEWWRLNTQYFPTLARMARDFLSIQIITPNSYMNHRDLYSNTRFKDKSDMVKEAFICSRNWLKSYESDMVEEAFVCSRENPYELRRRKEKKKKTSRRPDRRQGEGRDRRRRRRTAMEEQIKEEEEQ